MKTYAFGVDVGGTTVKMGLFQTSGKLLDTWEIKTRTEENGVYILSDIKNSVLKKMEENNIKKNYVEGIGIGVPGPVNSDGLVYRCVNLGWGVFNIEKDLAVMTGLKVKAGNDANVAALGEIWQGGGKGYRSIVMVTLGTGVGGGVIIDGKIVAGANGAAGEIGHIHIKDDENELCGCGKKGCLEQYASATGIVRMTKKYFAEQPDIVSILSMNGDFSAKDIFDAAKNGDTVGNLMIEETAALLGKTLSKIACVINPAAFVIGGGMANAGDNLIQLIKKYYIQYAFHASEDIVFKKAQLSNNAGIYGGVKLLLD